MLKDKSKEQLIEIIYKLENERSNLLPCYNKQSKILEDIAQNYHCKNGFFAMIIHFFALPYRIFAILKKYNEYFFTYKTKKRMKFDEKKILQALDMIVGFETKKVSAKTYKDFVSRCLGISDYVCDTCGDVMERLHNDFQKRINAEIERNGLEYLLKKIEFKSGKYSGEFYTRTVPKSTFKALLELKATMKSDVTRFLNKGLKEQSKLINDDLKALEIYIKERLNGVAEDESKSGEIDVILEEVSNENIGGTEVIENIEDAIEKIPSVLSDTEGVENEIPEVEPIEVVEENNDAEVAKAEDESTEKIVFSLELALELKEQGMTLEEMGKYFNVSAATMSRRLAKAEK